MEYQNKTMTKVLAGKRGLVFGIANERSIAWGIAERLAAEGAALALTYQGEAFAKRVEPLAEKVAAAMTLRCDVSDPISLDQLFEALQAKWGTLDFLVHSIAYSDKEELKGRFIDTSAANFQNTMQVSCYSFTEMARRVRPLMVEGGGNLITLSYLGAERVIPAYNVMGVAKAALEASVKYLATDLGPDGIRVNAISAGPMRTLAGSAVAAARQIYRRAEANAPLRRSVTLEQLGGSALYLLSDLSTGVTGEVHHVDSGFNIVGLAHRSGDPVQGA
ncbi:MAG: SDR family oxidoreductase [Pseudomonadota bacterium]|nr:SDR family oxidoreductase [Pseudomonadota bacterium]